MRIALCVADSKKLWGSMRLDQFIASEMEPILQGWEKFAATLRVTTQLSRAELRDHAREILEAVVRDLRMPQTAREQRDKSWGQGEENATGSDAAAQAHAYLRARSGFDVCQLSAEYRALRASVLRLWVDRCSPEPPHLDDMIRFNEAIDEALAEAIRLFSEEVNHSRNLLLSALGHDMRTPLQTIKMTALLLTTLGADREISEAASRLTRSTVSLQRLVNDLLDYNRTKLGFGMEMAAAYGALHEHIAQEIDQLRATYPAKELKFSSYGDTTGTWDGQRLQQLLANLVVNAFKYGAADQPVRVALVGEAERVVLTVSNTGPAIKIVPLNHIFDPLIRGNNAKSGDVRERGSLGLGLYIAREIAKAHAGTIDATSDDRQTVFTVVLPRTPAPAE